MRLPSLIRQLSDAKVTGNLDIEIKSLAYDSRQVKPGMLFFAISGLKFDGHDYIDDAVRAGAVGVVVERSQSNLPNNICQIKVADSRMAMALFSSAFYHHPSSKLKLIGVTGTNGKTTTSFLIEKIFSAAGKKTGLIGTIEYMIAGKSYTAERTTPESLDLQAILASMVKAGVEVAVMEVSSHASQLKRIDGCHFSAFVFTNLTQDHLDFHQSMDQYFQAKARLFTDPRFAGASQIVNIDDEYGRRLCFHDQSCLTYGFSSEAAVRGDNLKHLDSGGLSLSVSGPGKFLELSTGMNGIFNGENILAAVSAAWKFGVPDEAILKALMSAKNVSGRFEPVNQGQTFQVIVDYAHTPDGLRQLLRAARTATSGRIITVFGCGGDRDRAKRPLMGKIVGKLSDIAIVTSDNPRSERPEKIIDDILEGMGNSKADYKVIIDRHQAIKVAISQAKKGDIVLIAGKGHETGQIFADKIVPFDDRLVAKEILKENMNETPKSA